MSVTVRRGDLFLGGEVAEFLSPKTKELVEAAGSRLVMDTAFTMVVEASQTEIRLKPLAYRANYYGADDKSVHKWIAPETGFTLRFTKEKVLDFFRGVQNGRNQYIKAEDSDRAEVMSFIEGSYLLSLEEYSIQDILRKLEEELSFTPIEDHASNAADKQVEYEHALVGNSSRVESPALPSKNYSIALGTADFKTAKIYFERNTEEAFEIFELLVQEHGHVLGQYVSNSIILKMILLKIKKINETELFQFKPNRFYTAKRGSEKMLLFHATGGLYFAKIEAGFGDIRNTVEEIGSKYRLFRVTEEFFRDVIVDSSEGFALPEQIQEYFNNLGSAEFTAETKRKKPLEEVTSGELGEKWSELITHFVFTGGELPPEIDVNSFSPILKKLQERAFAQKEQKPLSCA